MKQRDEEVAVVVSPSECSPDISAGEISQRTRDTYGLLIDDDPRPGGAALDSASVAVSEITTPAELLPRGANSHNNENGSHNNENGSSSQVSGAAKEEEIDEDVLAAMRVGETAAAAAPSSSNSAELKSAQLGMLGTTATIPEVETITSSGSTKQDHSGDNGCEKSEAAGVGAADADDLVPSPTVVNESNVAAAANTELYAARYQQDQAARVEDALLEAQDREFNRLREAHIQREKDSVTAVMTAESEGAAKEVLASAAGETLPTEGSIQGQAAASSSDTSTTMAVNRGQGGVTSMPPGAYPVVGPGFNMDEENRRPSTRDDDASALVQGEGTTEAPHHVPEAFLVEEEGTNNDEEVFVASIAEPELPWWQQKKTKIIMSFIGVLIVGFSIALGVTLSRPNSEPEQTTQAVPTEQPSPSPTFDQRPTLEIVQERGYVKCGFRQVQIDAGEGFLIDLCRATASVLFGNPDSYATVPITGANRFQRLHDRSVDLILSGDTHTIEREVREKTTGAGFSFSSPFFYDGSAYYGNETMVECAEEQTRYGECSSLLICVNDGTSVQDFVRVAFPSDFYVVETSPDDCKELLVNGECNVIAQDRSILLDISMSDGLEGNGFIIGGNLMTKEPLAIGSRKDDREFSDILNWIVQALFYGEEQGLSRDMSLCQNYTSLTSRVSDLYFLNAVYCVGSYDEIVFAPDDRGMNKINDGITGMHYAIPFGNLNNGDNEGTTDTHLASIRSEGLLHCGVLVPEGFTTNIFDSDGLYGLSLDYCHTLAASLFNGDSVAVIIHTFEDHDDSAFISLSNGTVDVLAGARITKSRDFASTLSPRSGGFHFSTPYYYGNETATFFALATQDNDVVFSSFVNCIVLATIHAQENIDKGGSKEMPLMSVFGSEFNWALRDAIAYSGSYDQLYTKHFGEVAEEDRGRNTLNNNGGPQLQSLPGLDHFE